MNDAPATPKLTPLLREHQFYAALVAGLPALAVAYALAWRLLDTVLGGGALDIDAVGVQLAALGALLAANPVTVYLATRQYARGKSVEAFGRELAARPLPPDALDLEALPVERLRDLLPLDPGDRAALERLDAEREQTATAGA